VCCPRKIVSSRSYSLSILKLEKGNVCMGKQCLGLLLSLGVDRSSGKVIDNVPHHSISISLFKAERDHDRSTHSNSETSLSTSAIIGIVVGSTVSALLIPACMIGLDFCILGYRCCVLDRSRKHPVAVRAQKSMVYVCEWSTAFVRLCVVGLLYLYFSHRNNHMTQFPFRDTLGCIYDTEIQTIGKTPLDLNEKAGDRNVQWVLKNDFLPFENKATTFFNCRHRRKSHFQIENSSSTMSSKTDAWLCASMICGWKESGFFVYLSMNENIIDRQINTLLTFFVDTRWKIWSREINEVRL
jgi:hypothetical protein